MISPNEINTNDILFPVVWTIGLIIIDIWIYGWIVPIVGICFTGIVVDHIFSLEHCSEIILVIFSVSVILFALLYADLETKFWGYLFYVDQGFSSIFQIRDIVNAGMICFYFCCIFNSIQVFISTGMKKDSLTEGLGYVLFRPLVHRGLISESWLNFGPCHETFRGCEESNNKDCRTLMTKLANLIGVSDTREDPLIGSIQCDKQFVQGAEFIFSIACFTVSIIKLIYFNTLYSYYRAQSILIKMQMESSEIDEDSYDMNDELSKFH